MALKQFSLKKMWQRFLSMARSRFVQVSLLVGVLFLAGAFFLPIWRLFPELKDEFAIPLHYNIHSGVDLFGPWQRIFTIPIVGSIILGLNTIFAFILWERERVLSYFFLVVLAISEVFAFVSMIFVVLQLIVWIT